MYKKNHITKHAKLRIKQRTNSKNAVYNFKLAKRKGKRHYEFEGDLRRYLDYIAHKSHTNNIIIYNTNIYIIGRRDMLITVLNIPDKYVMQY